MPEEIKPVEGEKPATATQTTAQQPAKAEDPDWLPARLERAQEKARKDLLKELGVEDPKDVKAALADLKKRQDAEKTETERKDARIKELEADRSRADEHAKVIAARAAREMKSLTPEQSEAVKTIAGDDPAKQLATIDAMSSTWTKPVEKKTDETKTADEKKAASKDTAPPRGAAPKSKPGDDTNVDHLATYRDLQERNPFLAAQYRKEHGAALAKAEAAARK